MKSANIIVIDDEKNIRKTLSLVLEGEGYKVTSFGTAIEGLEFLDNRYADLVILDIKLPGMDGVTALEKIRSSNSKNSDVPILMISGHASLTDAVEAVKKGATDFFEKPLDRDEILIRVANYLEQSRLKKEVKELKAKVDPGKEIIGRSPAVKTLFSQLQKVAPTNMRVLITGESGTGKELIAKALHSMSNRSEMPFVKVNCAAIPGELIESELFGYEKGAFTGAEKQKPGQFEIADTGTLFLDEIGDMTLSAQAKVLRVLQSGEITRIGGQKPLKVDVRVVAATNKDLESAISNGEFREDLFFRLNVLPLHSPPLRARFQDIPEMMEAFIKRFCQENGYSLKEIDKDAMNHLKAYSWPGNVRELKNLAERLVIMSGEIITVDDLPSAITGVKQLMDSSSSDTPLTLKQFREESERRYILETLEAEEWNISKAAKLLSIERTNLHKKIKSLGIRRI
ncbi:MAG: sigma-54-dependent Fis family transcriptional regulator [Deltaproteobacteria bacterium]|nr:sigma-54-dependent Fis family transcriptional regulator [Deltaproteobacteria bacterium]